MRRVFIDVSELLANPVRTGIQRVVGQICRHWPNESPPVFAKIGPSGGLIEVAPGVREAIQELFECETASEPAADSIRELAAAADRKNRGVRIRSDDRLLVPELFYDEKRLSYYEALPKRQFRKIRFLVYDFLPLTHPEHFPVSRGDRIARYFRLVQRATHSGYISEQTRRDCCLRLRRDSTDLGSVLPLGGDSFGPRRPAASPAAPPLFAVIGTIEPRKRHDLVLEALEPEIRRKNPPFTLAFAGRFGWDPRGLNDRLRKLDETCDAFLLREDVGDEEVRRLLSTAWATLAVSEAEGFGLPALESLWMGVPVIANRRMPSLEGLEQGVERLEELSPEALRAAVHRLLDPEHRRQKAAEAAAADLPTWGDFGLRCFEMIHRS